MQNTNKSNGKKVTTIDIAKLSGVSQSTVSFVLNNKEGISISEETRKKVLDCANALGYVHKSASSRLKKKNPVIGYVFPSFANIFHFMAAQIIDSEAGKRGCHTVLCNTRRERQSEAEQVEWLISQKVDGIIYSYNPIELDLIETYSRQVPIVILAEKNYNININTVSLNSFKSGELIAEHLIELGHQNFAFITTPLSSRAISRKLRFEGVISTLQKYGLENHMEICQAEKENEALSGCGDEVNVGYALTKDLLSRRHDITAMIGLNDMFAIGICKALHESGIRIPEDISVCGFDNLFISDYIFPSLTTVDHFLLHRCRAALDMLIDHTASSGDDIIKIEYDPKLIIRGSTGPG